MDFYPKVAYNKISSKDELDSKEGFLTSDPLSCEDSESAADVASRRLKRAFIYVTSASFVLLVIVLGAGALFTHIYPSSHSHPSSPCLNDIAHGIPLAKYDCGWSVAEAQAKGCRWDYMANAWMPDQCSNAYGDEYNATASGGQGYQYFSDKHGQRALTHEELSLQNYTTRFWSTNQQHLTHCLFTFLRFYDAVKNGKRMTTQETSMGHATHCVDAILLALKETSDWKELNVYAVVQLLEC